MSILRSNKLLGAIFLVLLVVSVYMTYAAFTKKFADYERVGLQTSRIGLQLPDRADVKIRGVIVGEVLEFKANGDGALLELGLFPEDVEFIPEDVTGRIVPKTLFGEKYVQLVVPGKPAIEDITPIKAGAVIERTEVPTEVEEVLADLQPLLEAVQPADLNMTLNALVTALEGRGDQLGENLETVDRYLKKLNPKLPELVEDLRLTGEVSDIYSDVLPSLANTLDDQVLTLGTLEGREARLQALLNDTASFSNTTERFLDVNGDRLTRLGQLSARQFRVLSRYSTEFPCLLQGLVNGAKRQAETFRGFTLHINLEPIPRQPRAYGPGDQPRYAEDRGPSCLNLPNPPWTQDNPLRTQPNMNDGVDQTTGKGTSRAPTRYFLRDGDGYAGSPMETDMLKQMIAPGVGEAPEDLSDMSAMLIGPMARGAEVEYR